MSAPNVIAEIQAPCKFPVHLHTLGVAPERHLEVLLHRRGHDRDVPVCTGPSPAPAHNCGVSKLKVLPWLSVLISQGAAGW